MAYNIPIKINNSDHDKSLAITKAELIKNVTTKKGLHYCHECNGIVKLYPRKFNAGMAKTLVNMLKVETSRQDLLDDKGYMDVQAVFARIFKVNANRLDYSRPKVWGLIERRERLWEEKKMKNPPKVAGMWRLNEYGREVAKNHIRIQKTAVIFSPGDVLVGFEGEYITIANAFKDPFNYEELINKPVEGQKGGDTYDCDKKSDESDRGKAE